MSGTSSRLHVIVVNDFASVTGGSDRVAISEAIGLADRGHRVSLVAGHGDPDRALHAAGVEVHSTNQATTLGDPLRVRAAARGIWNPASARLLRTIVADADPDSTVIHLHGFIKVLSPSVVRAAAMTGLPMVATLHDYFAACPNGGFFNYQTQQVCRLTPLSRECLATNCDVRMYAHKLWRVARSEVQLHAGRMPTAVRHFVVPSRFAGEIMRPYLPGAAALHVLPNPVTGPRQPPADPGAGTGFVFIGRLNPDKGPTVFAAAAARAGVPAVFVGDGVERAAAQQLCPGATFTGWLESHRLREVVRSARAVVNTSLWYETQGLSAIEAAAQGIPAVIPAESALRDAVVDGETGLWFRSGDAADLAERLRRLSDDDELVRRLGLAAYAHFWATPLSAAAHLDALEAIYAEALTAAAAA